MAVQKHYRADIKKKYLASKHTEVKSFINDIGMAYNSETRRRTKGWTKEKKELKEKAADKAIKNVEEKLVAQLEPSAEFLLGNISKAIELSAVKLKQMEEKGTINVKDLNTIWGMNRIQNNMPTTYVKSENENNNITRIESISIILGPNPKNNIE